MFSNHFMSLHNEDYYYTKCKKCSGTFKVDSQKNLSRPSCRIHRVNSDGICNDCGKSSDVSHNCYHIRQLSWLQWLFSCFS